MSLPKLLDIETNNIPFAKGYIIIDRILKEEWKNKLGRTKGKKLIGIHWQGNPEFEKTTYSKGRSINVESMKILRNLENTQFISLQKGKFMRQKEVLNDLDIVPGQALFDKTLDFKQLQLFLNCDW